MPPRPRRLSEADRALWESYAHQLAPLKGRTAKKAAAQSPAATQLAVTQPAAGQAVPQPNPGSKPKLPKIRTSAHPLAVGAQPGGLDKATWNRFRTGKLATLRTLDLHGMTAHRAHQALLSFLRTAHAEQVRYVEVVTGRGTGDTGGVIRREFPHWLNLPDIRPLILGATHPHALNPGSVRLILRRIR